MTHIRMILKHLSLSGMVGMLQTKISWFWGCILLPLLCSMSLISPNFAVKWIIFSQFWPRAFSQNCMKKPCVVNNFKTISSGWDYCTNFKSPCCPYAPFTLLRVWFICTIVKGQENSTWGQEMHLTSFNDVKMLDSLNIAILMSYYLA